MRRGLLQQFTIYLLLSALLVIFAQYLHLMLVYFILFLTRMQVTLSPLFNAVGLGATVRKMLVLITLPLLLAGIAALSYRLIHGKAMPHFMPLLWLLWTFVMLSNLLVR